MNFDLFKPGRHSGPRDNSEVASPRYLSSSLYNDPKLSPVQKRGSASPSPSINSLGKDHSVRNSVESTSGRLFDTGVQEITEIPDDYLSQSSVLKHLAKEVKVPSPQGTVKKNEIEALEERLAMKDMPLKYDHNAVFDVDNLPPPPEYPKWAENNRPNVRSKISAEKLSLSKSQPDLSTVGLKDVSNLKSFRRGVSVPRPKTKGRAGYDYGNEEMMWPSGEIVEILIKENSALKMEVEQCYQKVGKAQKVNSLFFIFCFYVSILESLKISCVILLTPFFGGFAVGMCI